MFNSKLYLSDLKRVLENIDYKNLKDKSIFISGSCGLICSYLVDLIIYANEYYDNNTTIYALSRSEDKLKERFSYYYGNKLFKPVISNVESKLDIDSLDYIIHGASNANPKLYIEDPVGTMNANYIGMYNLLELAKKNNSKVVYISSSDVYGETTKDKEFLTETDSGLVNFLDVRNSYATSKRAAENLCISYSSEYDVDVKIVRPVHIFGPTQTKSDSRAVSDFIRNVCNGEDIVMKSDGSSVRSYCYVGDLATALFKVLFDSKKGEVYNISNNNNIVSIKELATMISSIGNQKLVIELPSDYVAKKIDSNVKVIKLDNSKIKSIGWEPNTSVKEGLNLTINIIKENI